MELGNESLAGRSPRIERKGERSFHCMKRGKEPGNKDQKCQGMGIKKGRKKDEIVKKTAWISGCGGREKGLSQLEKPETEKKKETPFTRL